MPILLSLIPVLLIIFPPILVIVAIRFWKNRSPTFRRKNPINRDMLRSPGQTLRAEIEEIDLDINGWLVAVMTTPLLFYSILLTIRFFIGTSFSTANIVFYVIGGIAAEIFCGLKLIEQIRRKRNLTIGLEAETSVGQSLNELVRDGASVFHDFPADGFNIDHIVVSTKGVHAVETKGRSKPVDEDGKTSYELTYDGNTLKFPRHTETEPLEQSKRQAKWLQAWLSSAVGEPIEVRPVLAIPGWRIQLAGSGNVFVFNPKVPGLLMQNRKDTLLPAQISRIVHQLDSRCRNVKPSE